MTVRLRLTMAFIAVILVANSILSLVTVRHIGGVWLEEVQSAVRLDLNSARAAYNAHIDGITRYLRAACLDERLSKGLAEVDYLALNRLLQLVRRVGGMDMLTVLDAKGRVCCRTQNVIQRGDDLSDNPIVARVLQSRQPATGTIVLTEQELQVEGRDLAERARFRLLPTPAARPTEDVVRSSGMVVGAGVPILGSDRELLGVLYGGDLLNRRYEIVDGIKDEVFRKQVYKGRPVGTVTVFQHDLRVSTNVVQADGTRAVGTRLSDVVYQRVLEEGGIWADRAFVVDDWYITAYEPIRDPTGRIIGALYVGLLEAPFTDQQRVIIGVFLAMVTVTTLTSLALLFFVTKLVLRPIGQIVTMSQKVVQGDLSARVGIRPPGEMGELCRAVDAMADAVYQREEQLKLTARKQIGQSEKLASIGRLAAGIAHEINNPLTGVLTFAHLLRQKGNLSAEDQQDVDLIIKETSRVAEIVRGLLDFARERPSEKRSVDINHVIRQTLRLVSGQKLFADIAVQEKLDENLPRIMGDDNQLQQVMLNLTLNASEAMPDGGTLTLKTCTKDGKVHVTVADTGCGIPREHLDDIFEPFFSTKPVGKGTGLGLSVSYGIIQQHGGSLEVESDEGKGTAVTIVLPPAGEERTGRRDESE